jgi:hypothetical protein
VLFTVQIVAFKSTATEASKLAMTPRIRFQISPMARTDTNEIQIVAPSPVPRMIVRDKMSQAIVPRITSHWIEVD